MVLTRLNPLLERINTSAEICAGSGEFCLYMLVPLIYSSSILC